jgi:flagellar hook-length control protein FliK
LRNATTANSAAPDSQLNTALPQTDAAQVKPAARTNPTVVSAAGSAALRNATTSNWATQDSQLDTALSRMDTAQAKPAASTNPTDVSAAGSAALRGATTANWATDDSELDTTLSQTDTAQPKLSTKIDDTVVARIVVSKANPIVDTAVNTSSNTSTRASDKTSTSVNQPKVSSPEAQQSSAPTSRPVNSLPQNAPSVLPRVTQGMGPVLAAPLNPHTDKVENTDDKADFAPKIVQQDAAQSAGEAPSPTSTPTPGKQRAEDDDTETSDRTSATPQSDAPIAASSEPVQQTSTPAQNDDVLAQLVSSNPSDSRLNAPMQPVQHSPQRSPAVQPPPAPASAPQPDSNGGNQAAATQSQSNGSENPGNGRGHSDQSRDTTDNGSSQRAALSTDAASAIAAPTLSVTPANNGAANAPADAAGNISASIGAQNAGAGSGTQPVAPTAQMPAPSAQPDINTLAISIAARSQAGAKQFDISLDPPELGRVEVRLTVDAAGKAQAHLVAERPETVQMLQRDSGTLTRALRDSGVQLGDNGLQFSLKGQGRQGDGAQQDSARAKPLAAAAVSAAGPVLPISSTYGLAYSRAGIDIRV